jgi:hypothetical protein
MKHARHPGWRPLVRATAIPKSEDQKRRMREDLKRLFPDCPEEDIDKRIEEAASELTELWKNHLYQVHVIRHTGGPDDCGIIQLSIKRNDRAPIHDWRDFQRIKTQLCGPEHEGIELYPAESRLVDTATQYHIWVIDDPTFRWPIGYNSGRTVIDKPAGGAYQRPREEIDREHD